MVLKSFIGNPYSKIKVVNGGMVISVAVTDPLSRVG
jgi:hypothetical protein